VIGWRSRTTRANGARVWLSLAGAISLIGLLAGPVSALQRNTGKYGAMFYWWFERLPTSTLYPPTLPWDARNPSWWAAMVRQAHEAGLGWVAPDCWGVDSPADPATLTPLLRAIDTAAPGLKIAFFDDTTSEVLRKNRAHGRGWTNQVRFDLADLKGEGEGGLSFFYEEQWKRFFETVPQAYRLTIDGRPVVFMWVGGYEFYAHQNFFHADVDGLRAAVRRDFGVDPFVIVEESWIQLDPTADADAVYDWFQPHHSFATAMTWKGVRVGQVVPGYDCSRCSPPGPVLPRQGGAFYRAGLQAVAPNSDLVLIDGLNNVDENDHIIETATWGRLYLAITRWFTANLP
jgi:Domain of unknown function (DUF5010)